jgi:TonB family protein
MLINIGLHLGAVVHQLPITRGAASGSIICTMKWGAKPGGSGVAFYKRGSGLLVSAVLLPLCLASVERPARLTDGRLNDRRERQFGSLAVRDANFSAMPRMATRASCEAAQPPEALATPDPLVGSPVVGSPAEAITTTVSFIVGTDGRVHSPLILESLGPSGDRLVLDAVRSWRYRPATCNGVPTEVEAKIAFSSR